MIPTRTLGKPFFLNLPRFYHEASRLHFLQLLANTVAGRWGTSLDVLWSETLMWWNSNLETWRGEYQGMNGIVRKVCMSKYILQAIFFGHIGCQVLTSTSLHNYRISAPFIYLTVIRWYLLPIRPSYPINQTTRLNLSGQKSRWKGSELRRLSSPHMNHTLTCQSVLAEWCP